MKKFVSVVLAAVMALSLAACASKPAATTAAPAETKAAAAAETKAAETKAAATEAPKAEAKAFKVALCLPDIDQYWTGFQASCIKELEAAGCEGVEMVYAKEDISTQIGQVEGYKNNGYDAVVVGITNGESFKEIMNAAGDMKVVFFNRSIDDNSVLNGTQYIYAGMSEYDAGYAQGTWLADYFKAEGKTDVKGMLFKGPLGLANVEGRSSGAKDALKANGINVDWVFEDTAEWDRVKAMDKFTQFSAANEFDFVVANNDEMALGVVEACLSTGKEINFPIVGIDATQPGCNAIGEGNLKMTVNQDGPGQGKAVAKAIMEMLAGKVPEACASDFTIATAAQSVTLDNYKDVLANF